MNFIHYVCNTGICHNILHVHAPCSVSQGQDKPQPSRPEESEVAQKYRTLLEDLQYQRKLLLAQKEEEGKSKDSDVFM